MSRSTRYGRFLYLHFRVPTQMALSRRKYQSSSTTKRNIYEVEGDESSSSLSPPPEEPIQKKCEFI